MLLQLVRDIFKTDLKPVATQAAVCKAVFNSNLRTCSVVFSLEYNTRM